MLHTSHVSCCASLRQALLQGWQQSFPLHSSPFRQMAASSGATPRELLALCQDLHRKGSLQLVLPTWGDGLLRTRWRLAFSPAGDDAPLARALAALPGCFHMERSTEPVPGLPSVWAEMEASDDASLDRQLHRLPLLPVARIALAPVTPGAHACDDVDTARALEAGLQLCSRPYAECARRLGCSESKLLARLLKWRRSGVLAGLSLKPPPSRVPQPGLLALWTGTPAPEALQKLHDHPGIDRVITAPGTVGWPWRLSVVLHAAPQLALDQLREAVLHVGLRLPDASLKLQIERPRDHALLFRLQATDA
ncbi:MAG: Lrp/AsnC family transcriptional regulator [Burkholderiales bacterium]|nr:MAG: Lrp/AsnC family transcriptional regulator [Burkholderiales bacterium]